MTQEEIIEILERFVLGAKPCSQREIVDACASAYGMLKKQPSLPSNLDEAANRQAALEQPYKWEEEQDGSFGVTPLFVMSNIRSAFKAGAEWQKERMEDEHGKELLYVCQKTAEREHRSGVREGKVQAEKGLIPLINRLCEAILFGWEDAADLARETLTQIKARRKKK